MIGKVLGNRYEIIEKIGGGGMARVYKARCRLLNRFVAIKVLRYELLEDEDFVNRFNVEAQAAASLSHANIVSIYDVGKQGDIHYIVMEYIKGITLKEMINRNGYLPWEQGLNIAKQICSALEHAHNNNIIHRDIKPHNIMITMEGRIKVTDFGIARAATSSTVTLGGNTIGSVHYFSPEQARGSYTDERSDIYSLGIVMYEMLTGRVPFDAETPVSVAMKHIQEYPKKPRDINDEIPDVIESIILKAISKEQNHRYASAADMMVDISKAIQVPDVNFVQVDNLDDSPTQKVPIINPTNGSEEMTVNKKKVKKKKMKKEDKRAVVAAIITSFIIILGLVFIGSKFMNNVTREKPVPNLVGQNIESVKALYDDEREFKINEVKEEYSTEYDEGQIITQKPSASTSVKLPYEIKVTVSAGPKMVQMPNLVGEDYRMAEITVKQKELRYVIQNEYNEKVPAGYVIRHIPEPLKEIKEGTLVYLYVSDGPEIKTMMLPNLVGKDESEAKKIIGQLGLVVGKTERVFSDKAKNTIISQSIAANTEVEEKTVVDLVISDGQKEQLKTRIYNVYIPQDKDQVEVKLMLKDEETSNRIVYKNVHTKEESPLSVELTGKGKAIIEVYFDNEFIGTYNIDFGGVE